MDGTQQLPQAADGAARGAAGAMGGRPPGGFPGGPGGRGGMFLFGPYTTWILLGLLVVTFIVLAIVFWKFLSKAGLQPAVALLMLVPVVNVGVALWAAFTEWPALREIARLKERVATYELRAQESEPAGAGYAPPSASATAGPGA